MIVALEINRVSGERRRTVWSVPRTRLGLTAGLATAWDSTRDAGRLSCLALSGRVTAAAGFLLARRLVGAGASAVLGVSALRVSGAGVAGSTTGTGAESVDLASSSGRRRRRPV
jgi:hypothetical protein